MSRTGWWLLLTAAVTVAVSAIQSQSPIPDPQSRNPEPLVRITLREKATVSAPVVRLGDIADIVSLTEAPTAQTEGLANLIIAPSPLPRYTRVITAGDIATKLAQAGWRSGSFVLEGARQVLVARSGRQLTASELETLLQKALGTTVKLLLPPPAVLLPEGELSVQAEMPSTPRANLLVTLLVNGQPVATLRVLVQVALPNGDKVAAAAREASNLQAEPPKILVRRRQPVRLLVRVNRVAVEAQGTALQDGKMGDEVLVAVAWSKTPLKGIVTGEREVTIPTW